MNWKTCYAVLSGVLGLALASDAPGAVQWHFNWYCSGCARIGARTTGTNGPFSSREACESTRSSMQSTMNARGGGVNTVACQPSGVDMPAPQSSTSAPPSGYRGGGYTAPQQQTQQPGIDYEQQRRAEEERRRQEEEARQAEAERQRREEFARSRDQALGLLKGGTSGELTIKGLDSGGELGLKTPDVGTLRDAPSSRSKSQAASKCSPNQDASVVDLCDRDATKPIDPRTVQGKPRIQVSEKTLTNENYIKGFDAIRAGNYSLAVSLFKNARAQLGNDVLVRNALALAEDLLKVHQKKFQRSPGADESHESLMSAIKGDYDAAVQHMREAVRLEPENRRYREEYEYMVGIRTGVKIGAEEEQTRQRSLSARAMNLASESLATIHRGDWSGAVAILEAARALDAKNPAISDLLVIATNARDREAKQQSKGRVAANVK